MNCMVTSYKHKYKQLAYDQTKLLQRFLFSLLHSLTVSAMVIFLMSFLKEHVYFIVDIHSCVTPIHSFSRYYLRSYYAGTGSSSKQNRQMPCPSVTKPDCSQTDGPGVSGSWIVDRTYPLSSPHPIPTKCFALKIREKPKGTGYRLQIYKTVGQFLANVDTAQSSHAPHPQLGHHPFSSANQIPPSQQVAQETFLGPTSLSSRHLFPNRPFIPRFSSGLEAIFGAVQCYEHDQKQQ